jgi:hypothetical protein
VNLLPSTPIDDADIAGTLHRAVRIIGPILDVLWDSDPASLKRRQPRDGEEAGPLDRVADGIGWVLNAADVPGTLAWDDMDLDARINWWVRRVGAVNNVAVAFPGFLGVLARQLPVQDLLGFVNQAVVLCAVAREMGVTDRDIQVRMLAQVLCNRTLVSAEPPADEPPAEPVQRSAAGVAKALWKLAGLLNSIGDEVARRPHPRAPFRWLGMLPAVGAVASYFGELGALSRAAKAGRRWLSDHAVETSASSRRR